MKKQTKMMAVLSAAAFMSALAPNLPNFAGAANTVYAKTTGWVEEEGKLRFYEDETYYATDSWKKKDNDWYYLNEDGYITTSSMVDEFYVNAEGKRVSNTWISVFNEDDYDSENAPENFWFYYGKDGKSTQSKWIKLDDNHYYFDSEGRMLTGKVEIENATYYLGDENDGKMKKGWVQLENTSDDPETDFAWFYFDNSGKMVENQVDKKIEGSYYTFVDGQMQTGWYKLPVTGTASDAEKKNSVSGYQYYELEGGKRAQGWYDIEGVKSVSEEGEVYRFYFKNGQPHHAEKGLQLFTVDSKRYAFNTKGEMQTGLEVVNVENDEIANFYFGTDGVMKTGKQTVYNEETGENQIWYFHTDGSRKGQGVHGIKDNTLYVYGLRQEADADLRFAPADLDGTQYLINTSGSVQKAGSSSKSVTKPELGNGFKDVKDTNDKVWIVDTNGVVQQ